MNVNVLELLRQQQADNRSAFARKLKAEREAELSKQQFEGTFLGPDAEQGCCVVQIDGGGVIPCESVTSGSIKPGQRVIVTIPEGATKGFIGGMPA